MDYKIIILIFILIILTLILIKITKFIVKIAVIVVIVMFLIYGYNYIKQSKDIQESSLECSLSRCDCKCYPLGQTPEEKDNVLCGINCESIYNVSSCSILNNTCIEIKTPENI